VFEIEGNLPARDFEVSDLPPFDSFAQRPSIDIESRRNSHVDQGHPYRIALRLQGDSHLDSIVDGQLGAIKFDLDAQVVGLAALLLPGLMKARLQAILKATLPGGFDDNIGGPCR